MSSLFEENDQILDELEQAEHRLEKIKIDGADSVDSTERSAIAATIKNLVSRLAVNIAASGGKVDKLGGAVVLADLLEVLERYEGVFEIPGIADRLAELRQMIEDSSS